MPNYGRVDIATIREMFAGSVLTGAIISQLDVADEIQKFIAIVEAADLYAAEPSEERLGILNECLDVLPQLTPATGAAK